MKKKVLLALLLFLLIFNMNPTKAEEKAEKKDSFEEVTLVLPEVDDSIDIEETNNVQQAAAISSISREKSLKEKLQDVYKLEINRYDKPSYLFEEILTKRFDEDSKMDRLHLWGAYNGELDFSIRQDGAVTNHYDFNALNVGLDGFLKDNNADFRIMLGILPRSDRNMVQGLPADVYIATNKIPHHRFLIGHTRPPVGYEGGSSSYTLAFLGRSQIARTFGTARKLGIRGRGEYSLIDYDLGIYSSDTYFQEFFPGTEFVGWVNFKPLGKTDGKYGKLKIGGGLQAGKRDNNYCVTGAYVGYEYKRLMAEFEWSHANGYNGTLGRSVTDHASGFYATLGYMITKKLQALICYDQFDPDTHIKGNKRREYVFGLNYFIKGQALRLIFNYAFCQNDSGKDSHRLLFGTQILI